TMGEDGAWAATPGAFRRLPAPPAPNVVDPTGCGDVFAAAAIAGMLRGWSVFEAAAAGVELATRAVGAAGLRETYRLASRARTGGFFDRFGGRNENP
ncbi:MAG: PfkB family carbohydrate kinase, partial [Candidatus Aminicenantales bacterium]